MKCLAYALLAVSFLPASVQAGCSCLSGHDAGSTTVLHQSPMVATVPIMAGPLVAGVMPVMPVAFQTPPPPGTLGQTYSRASHPVPDDEHPRSAMLAVRDHNAIKYLKAQNMGGFRMKNGIWLFETDRPLFPGAEHIVRVEAREDKNDIQPFKVKFVRLIPGRIVYLDF
jgi:hypothetical protein